MTKTAKNELAARVDIMNDIPLPPGLTEERLASLLSGSAPEQQVGPDGRYTCGTFAGMTPADVRADRDRFNRGSSASLLRRLQEAARGE